MEDSVFNKDYDTMVMDTGYIVFHHDYGSSVAIIKKKSRGRSLTVAEKSRTFSLASVRSKIERVFGAPKSKFKIISDNSRPFDGTPEKLHYFTFLLQPVLIQHNNRLLLVFLAPKLDVKLDAFCEIGLVCFEHIIHCFITNVIRNIECPFECLHVISGECFLIRAMCS